MGTAVMVPLVNGAVVATGSDTQGRGWTATFDVVNGNQLQITLANTAIYPPITNFNASQGLLGLYFNIDGEAPLALTPSSAVLGSGSTAVGNAGNPGAGWAYNSGQLAVGGASYNNWLVAAGLGALGGSGGYGNFCTADCVKLRGPDFAIYPTGFSNGNASVKVPYFVNTVVFTLSGLPQGFNLASLNQVSAQYGGNLVAGTVPASMIDYGPVDSHSPEPGTASVLLIAGAIFGAVAWLRRLRDEGDQGFEEGRGTGENS